MNSGSLTSFIQQSSYSTSDGSRHRLNNSNDDGGKRSLYFGPMKPEDERLVFSIADAISLAFDLK